MPFQHSTYVVISAHLQFMCTIRTDPEAMSVAIVVSNSTSPGYQPPQKKPKLLHHEADGGEQYKLPTQPGRVPLNKIRWHPQN